MEYKGVPVMMTTVTECQGCWCLVAHLSQRRHDTECAAAHPCRCRRDGAEPVLEEAS